MLDSLLIWSQGREEPACNMAWDEALLEASARLGRPVLRFYGWTIPCATFGYFQRYADVEAMTLLRPLLRRPTAGGLVPHAGDWTYSLVVPPGTIWYEMRAPESYRELHQWLARSLSRLGIVTHLADKARKETPGQCFAGPDPSDVLWQDQKVAGAAQRRNRMGLLVQGSIQPLPEWSRALWEQAMVREAQERWCTKLGAFEPDATLTTRALALVREKYGLASHHQRR